MLFLTASQWDTSSSRAMAGTHFLATDFSWRHSFPAHTANNNNNNNTEVLYRAITRTKSANTSRFTIAIKKNKKQQQYTQLQPTAKTAVAGTHFLATDFSCRHSLPAHNARTTHSATANTLGSHGRHTFLGHRLLLQAQFACTQRTANTLSYSQHPRQPWPGHTSPRGTVCLQARTTHSVTARTHFS